MQILLAGLSYKPHYGGIENSFFYMAKVYSSLGHKVVIMAGDKTLSGEGRLPEHEIIDGINIYRFKRFQTRFAMFKLFIGPMDIIKSYFYVKKLEQKYKFKMAILRNAQVGLGVVSALKCIKTIYVLSAVESIQDRKSINEFENNKLFRWFKYKLYNQIVLRQATFFQRLLIKNSNSSYVFSMNMKKQVSQIISKYDFKISLINPGVDTLTFSPPKDKAQLRKELNLPENANIFIVLGRIVKVKGIDYAIKAISELGNPNSYLLIVGDGPETTTLNNLATELDIKEKVLFFPYTSTPNSFFQVADAFLMPSTYEAFGQTILEAMSSGLPILGFKSNGSDVMTATNEIVENGVNGFLCNFSVSDLSNTLSKFLSLSRQELVKINVINRKKVSDHFTWNNFCKSLIEASK